MTFIKGTMLKRRNIIAVVVVLAVAVAGTLWWVERRPEDRTSAGPAVSGTELGLVYVPVTAQSAPYYGLSVDHGALVTQVVRGSAADQSGLRPGDVIIAFNGTRIGEGVSLFSLLSQCVCVAGDTANAVSAEVLRDGTWYSVPLSHVTSLVN